MFNVAPYGEAMKNYLNLIAVSAVCLASASLSHAQTYSASNFASFPPLLTNTADPFVMISLSVELTQQAEAYTDGEQTYVGAGTYCPGRVDVDADEDGTDDLSGAGVCYHENEIYIGYFDPEKCYVYDTSGANTNTTQDPSGINNNADPHYFRPVSYANGHKCSGAFSGNYMNWATMTALDQFRAAMVGGARLVDTYGENAKTLLTRTQRRSWPFVEKFIRSNHDGIEVGSETFLNSPSDVTPFAYNNLRAVSSTSSNNTVEFFRYRGGSNTWQSLGTYNVIVEVCNPTVGLEDNCVAYSDGTNTWYKPEGVMMENALDMKFAMATYGSRNGNGINGGVVRANAKYIGYYRPKTDGGLEINPNAEISQYGTFITNPDNLAGTQGGVVNSGLINYLNMFGLGGDSYKSNDPVSELYYESLKYIKGLQPTAEYANGLNNSQRDNFPVITSWTDPVTNACQANYMIAIGDQFSHADGDLPGTTLGTAPTSNPDNDIEAATFTNTVGVLEGHTDSPLGNKQRGRGDTYYIAGMAHYANTTDIRADLPGKQTVRTFIVDTQEWDAAPPMREYNQLWLAAKYGSFKDTNNDGDPNTTAAGSSTEEWDADGDGDPDGYTLASQPANLIAGLRSAFNEIAEKVNAGSAAGVVSNTAGGQGMVVQGLFKPKHTTTDGKIMEWGGILHALFIDEFDNIREDTNGDRKITNDDKVIIFNVDENEQTATVSRYETTDGGETVSATPVETGVDIEDLDTLWDARDRLAEVSDPKTQRSYSAAVSTAATGGRYIFTAIDTDGNNIVESSETIPFVETEFPDPASTPGNLRYRYLGLNSDAEGAEAPNIVNYIRGYEGITGYRSRTLKYKGTSDKPWILGDIVSSSPAVVAEPTIQERYDLIYNDDTFSEFVQKYKTRRNMVYVGANDGMLHAFNAGFYQKASNEFTLTNTTETAHPLGAEMWAYVPYNLLPHLQWLTDISYPHVFYVDGHPQAFTVNIFPDDETHPNGWGTILVVGMRFGGGEYEIDADGDGSNDTVLSSSYVVLDITDPEQPPTLIAEISDPDLGYTVGRPTIASFRERNASTGSYENPSKNNWYLVFGSGPQGTSAATKEAALDYAVSDTDAKVFVFDLINKSFVQSGTDNYFTVPNSSTGFTSDFLAVDWDKGDSYSTDAIYFGVVSNTVTDPKGDLMRFIPSSSGNMTGSTMNRLITNSSGSMELPFSGRAFAKAANGEHWVYFGSGRYFVEDDSLSTKQMGFYGVKEPINSTTKLPALTSGVELSTMVDVSDIHVQFNAANPRSANGTVYDSSGNPGVTINGTAVSSFSTLKRVISQGNGWYFNFENTRARQVGKVDGTGEVVAFTEYLPNNDPCDPLGETYLNVVHYKSGTAAPFNALDSSSVLGTATVSDRSEHLSLGLVRDVDFVDGRMVGQGNLGNLTGVIRPNQAESQSGRVSWREILINW